MIQIECFRCGRTIVCEADEAAVMEAESIVAFGSDVDLAPVCAKCLVTGGVVISASGSMAELAAAVARFVDAWRCSEERDGARCEHPRAHDGPHLASVEWN